jgi:hypothetical protein
MMGRGDKQMDVSTLRSLLPIWMRSAGFNVCFEFGENKTAEDCMMVSANIDTVRKYIARVLHLLTITDGCIAYKESDIKGTVLIRVWEGEEDG